MPLNVQPIRVSEVRRDADLRRLRDFVGRLSSAGGIDAADADSLLRLSAATRCWKFGTKLLPDPIRQILKG